MSGTRKLRPTRLEEAYQHFLLDRQSMPVAPSTLQLYGWTVGRFVGWVASQHPEVGSFDDLPVEVVRTFRAEVAASVTKTGRRPSPEYLSIIDRSLRTFFRWSAAEGYPVEPRILAMPRVRVPLKEPTLFHIKQVRDMLRLCSPERPHEALIIRILVGAGVRRAELCGLCLYGPDGLSDLMTDSLDRGIAELRVRGDAGAKGGKSRRVPVVPKLAQEIRRYSARWRPNVDHPQLIIGPSGVPYSDWAVKELMDRLQAQVGFRVHAHGFRHTFATVASQMGWNFERLRVAMGHSDYTTLHRYVRMSMERDLGKLDDWLEFIALPPRPQTIDLTPQYAGLGPRRTGR